MHCVVCVKIKLIKIIWSRMNEYEASMQKKIEKEKWQNSKNGTVCDDTSTASSRIIYSIYD